MAIIEKNIGTNGRHYATCTLWEAALGGAAGGAGNAAIGWAYDDSDFDEILQITDGTPDSILLSVAEGERHDGTAGSGVRQLDSTRCTWQITVDATIRWFEIDMNGQDFESTKGRVFIDPVSPNVGTLDKCIIHDGVDTATLKVFRIQDPGRLLNTIIYDHLCTDTGADNCWGVQISSTLADVAELINCTIDRIVSNNGSGNCYGISVDDDNANKNIKNTSVTGTGGTTSGGKADYQYAGIVNSTIDYNLSSDGSLPDALHNVQNKTAANLYVSNANGTEDYHLKAGADCIGAGTDLGQTPSGIEFDIDNFDRHTEAVVWDIGADQYVAVVSGNPWYYYAQQGAAA